MWGVPGMQWLVPGEEMAQGCIIGRRQPSEAVILGPVDVTLTHSTYLNNAADQVHSFMATVFPNRFLSVG